MDTKVSPPAYPTFDGENDEWTTNLISNPQDTTIITPRTFLLKRIRPLTHSIRVYDMSNPTSASPSNLDTSLLSGNSSDQKIDPDQDTGSEYSEEEEEQPAEEVKTTRKNKRVPAYFVDSVKGGYTLYEGPGPKVTTAPSRRLLHVKGEGWFSTKSNYMEAGDDGRATEMKRANHWWTVGRTIRDYNGNVYKWKNSFFDDITCVRWDGLVVARLKRNKLHYAKVGMLELKEPVPASVFNLILASAFIKWKEDRGRRQKIAAALTIAAI